MLIPTRCLRVRLDAVIVLAAHQLNNPASILTLVVILTLWHKPDYLFMAAGLHSFPATVLSDAPKCQHVNIVPVTKLYRSQLPLAWIESTSDPKALPTGTLLRSPILDPQGAQDDRNNPTLLIARVSVNEGLYAIESVEDNVVVVCQLRSWVTQDIVQASYCGGVKCDALHQIFEARKRSTSCSAVAGTESQINESFNSKTCSPKKPRNRRGILARKAILPTKRLHNSMEAPIIEADQKTPNGHTTGMPQSPLQRQSSGLRAAPSSIKSTNGGSISPQASKSEAANCLIEHNIGPDQSDNIMSASSDPGEILDGLRKQYLETLYTSKMSLAYFAKGPLARVRVIFQGPNRDEFSSSNLANFYRGSILSMRKMDLKYRETIANFLKALPVIEAPKNDGTQVTARWSTTRASKKKNIRKDGMFPTEMDFVRSWWHATASTSSSDLSAESEIRHMKKLLGDLRSRETEMQVLLILEAMLLDFTVTGILEKSFASTIKQEHQEDKDKEILSKTPSARKRKRDLQADLDLLIDWLCIWHTVGVQDDLTAPEKSAASHADSGSKAQDRLRDFYTDVVVPFYGSRLPEQCKGLCRKLGGLDISPKRRKPGLVKSWSTSRLPPGAPIAAITKVEQRPVLKRTLARVLSEEQKTRHASPPNLSRSSTAPSVTDLKGESSEAFQQLVNRSNIQNSRRFASREVDLVADARTHETKRRKLANLVEQKKELGAAIDALRKPNRGLAARGFAEEVEKRTSRLANIPIARLVQVAATPKKPKATDQSQFEPTLPLPPLMPLPEVLPNEVSIPSSAIRPRPFTKALASPRKSARKRAVLSAIAETPSRGNSKTSNPPSLSAAGRSSAPSDAIVSDGPPDLSSGPSTLSIIEATPAVDRLWHNPIANLENTPPRISKSLRPVALTPLKRIDVMVEDAFRDAPIVPEEAGRAMDRAMGRAGGGKVEFSIYETLGWNDDSDDFV